MIPPHLLPPDQRARAGDQGLRDRLRVMIHPAFYAAQLDLTADAFDVDTALDHFIGDGVTTGARVSALFNAEFYLARLAEAGLESAGHPFFDWLTRGWDQRIVPTPLFEEDFYLARHPEFATGPAWAFAQFARAGCYRPAWHPGRFGRNFGAAAVPGARERQHPVLLTGMLHRAEQYDLRRTSWLEEGVAAAARKAAMLASPEVQQLVARAAQFEPEIVAGPPDKWVSWPSASHPMLVTAARVEEVRRSLPSSHVELVVIVGSLGHAGSACATALVTQASSALIVTTDPGPSAGAEPGPPVLDLSARWQGLSDWQRQLCLLDVVRGLRPQRVVVLASKAGSELVDYYGTVLSNEMTLEVRS